MCIRDRLLLARRSRRSLRQASARAEAAGEFPARGGGAGGAEDEKELDGTAAREARSNDRHDRLSGAASARTAETATAGASGARTAEAASTSARGARAAATATAGASSDRAAATASASA